MVSQQVEKAMALAKGFDEEQIQVYFPPIQKKIY